MDRWFSIFGVPGKILSDNGGEFQNEEMRSMTEKWNIKILTTSAESMVQWNLRKNCRHIEEYVNGN